MCPLSSRTSRGRPQTCKSAGSEGTPCIRRLPLIHSNVAFTAVTSIATIGLYISYVIPTMLRLTIGRNAFVPGALALLHGGIVALLCPQIHVLEAGRGAARVVAAAKAKGLAEFMSSLWHGADRVATLARCNDDDQKCRDLLRETNRQVPSTWANSPTSSARSPSSGCSSSQPCSCCQR